MSQDLSSVESNLLVRLREQQAFKGNAQPICENGASDWREAEAAAGVLISRGLARKVMNSSVPAIIHLDLTPEGVGVADQIREVRRPKSMREKLSQWDRTDWIAIIALLVSLVALFK